MNRERIEAFARELFFGTVGRSVATLLGVAVMLVLIAYTIPILVFMYVFGYTFVSALGTTSNLVLLAMVLYFIYRLAVATREAWRSTDDKA